MGHMVNRDGAYRLLQQRLERMVTGAPDSPALMKILSLLFSPEEAEFASRIPGQLTSLGKLSRKLGIPRDELSGKMDEMARRGLVIDLAHDRKRYFALAPVVIGFFEMTFMRTRDDLPMTELARLFDQYIDQDDRFARSLSDGRTQLGRPLVHEEALRETNQTEILDWERASHIVRSAGPIGVSLCACRHKASHLGEACDQPQRVCLSLNYAAESVIRNKMADPVSVGEAMRILEDCKQAGLTQIGDNVKRKVAYICHCCGCCCGMIRAIKRFDRRDSIVTSNWIMEVDSSRCKGCGKCAQACPVDAIRITETAGPGGSGLGVRGSGFGARGSGRRARGDGLGTVGKGLRRKPDPESGFPNPEPPVPSPKNPRKWAECEETLCLGCGVCYRPCKFGAIRMKPRSKRVLTPETVFDRVVAMAIERGKLSGLIFGDSRRLSHRALGRIVGVIEKTPLVRAAMAIKPLRSAFLATLVGEAKKRTGAIGQILE